MHVSRQRITLLLLILLSTFLLLPLAGCGVSGDSAGTPDSTGTALSSAPLASSSSITSKEFNLNAHTGIKSFWTYDSNAIGGGGKAMANLWGGNFLLQYTDISFPGRGLPVEIRRTYNSQFAYEGYFGKGWTSLFDSHLEIEQDRVILMDAYGGLFVFTNPQPSGGDTVYVAPAGRNTIFTRRADGTFTEKKKNSSTYHFDNAGKLVRIQHRNTNNYLLLTYNKKGYPTGIQEASGRTTAVVCHGSHIKSITDPEGRSTTYRFKGDCLSGVTDPDGNETAFDYNRQDLLTTIQSPRAFESTRGASFLTKLMKAPSTRFIHTVSYDTFQRVSAYQDPLYTVNYQYTDQDTIVTDSYNHHLVYQFNDYGNLIHAEDTLGSPTTFEWDDAMNILSVKNAKDQETHFTYDERGNVLTSSNALYTLHYAYDSHNNLISHTDGKAGVTSCTYAEKPTDPEGVLESVTTPASRTVSFSYNDYAEPVAVINARGLTTRYAFDPQGNITAITDANNKMGIFAQNREKYGRAYQGYNSTYFRSAFISNPHWGRPRNAAFSGAHSG